MAERSLGKTELGHRETEAGTDAQQKHSSILDFQVGVIDLVCLHTWCVRGKNGDTGHVSGSHSQSTRGYHDPKSSLRHLYVLCAPPALGDCSVSVRFAFSRMSSKWNCGSFFHLAAALSSVSIPHTFLVHLFYP